MSEECNKSEIEKLVKWCQDILYDVEKTVQYAHSVEGKAFEKFEDASEPAVKCGVGCYEILEAAFVHCNPTNPGNPKECADTILGIPNTVSDCKKAFSLIREAIDLFGQASYLFGTAEIAFSDQGGDEIAQKLEKCNVKSCFEMGNSISNYSKEARKRSERNKDKLQVWINELEASMDKLENCKKSKSQCVKIEKINQPVLEPTHSPPSTDLP